MSKVTFTPKAVGVNVPLGRHLNCGETKDQPTSLQSLQTGVPGAQFSCSLRHIVTAHADKLWAFWARSGDGELAGAQKTELCIVMFTITLTP